MTDAKDAFTEVCSFCRSYNGASALTTGSAGTVNVRTALQQLKEWAESNFSQHDSVSLKVEVARGSGYFPKVPWLAILPPQQKVSDGVYFVLCFGREGAGGIAGCASSVTTRTGLQTVIRSAAKPLLIDVNGDRVTTLYNDAFSNPLQITPDDFDEGALKDHVRRSLDMAFSYIRKLQSPSAQSSADKENLALDEQGELEIGISGQDTGADTAGDLTPLNMEETRDKVFAAIKRRQGQPKFRKDLLEAYDDKCAITGTNVINVLEAAHIMPYRGKSSNSVSNGLILRADLHTLFDFDLMAIDPESMTVLLSPTLKDTEYAQLSGQRIRLPKNKNAHPNKDALAWRKLCLKS